MKVKTGVVLHKPSNAKDCQRLPANHQKLAEGPARDPKGTSLADTLILASRHRDNSCYLSCPVCGILLLQSWEMNTLCLWKEQINKERIFSGSVDSFHFVSFFMCYGNSHSSTAPSQALVFPFSLEKLYKASAIQNGWLLDWLIWLRSAKIYRMVMEMFRISNSSKFKYFQFACIHFLSS